MKKLIIFSLTTLLLSPMSYADCGSKLTSCNSALTSYSQLVKDQDDQIHNYQQKSALDEQIKADQAKQLKSPLHDPIKVAAGTVILTAIFYGLLGGFKR